MEEYEWIFQAAIALGTFLAVLVALFGEWAKSKWFKPDLHIRLSNPRGGLAKVTLNAPDGSSRVANARYYHLVVSNRKRWPVATQVQVSTLRIEEPNPGGSSRILWGGEVPLKWKFQEIYPLQRTIGAEADCDFLSVVEGKGVTLLAMVMPVEFPFLYRRGPFSGVVFTLQARSAETDSNTIRVRVSWDDKWNTGEVEMANHLVVEQLPDAPEMTRHG
jgi:hypothetical protein